MRQNQKITLVDARPASEINSAINAIPTAQEKKIFLDDGTHISSHKAITVNGRVIDIPSKYYQLVQHSQAFRPVIDGLTESGITKYNFQLISNDKKANLRIFTDSVNDGMSNIILGFQVINSFNRSTTVNYGISINKGHSYVELVGYRKVCSNGLMIRVDLENAEIVKTELSLKIKALFKESCKLRHSSNVHERIAGMQYVVEAIALLKDPLQRIISIAKKTVLDGDKIREIVKSHFSERMTKKILQKFNSDIEVEGAHTWALYNAITFEVSHNVSFAKHNYGLERANDVLQEALLEVSA